VVALFVGGLTSFTVEGILDTIKKSAKLNLQVCTEGVERVIPSVVRLRETVRSLAVFFLLSTIVIILLINVIIIIHLIDLLLCCFLLQRGNEL